MVLKISNKLLDDEVSPLSRRQIPSYHSLLLFLWLLTRVNENELYATWWKGIKIRANESVILSPVNPMPSWHFFSGELRDWNHVPPESQTSSDTHHFLPWNFCPGKPMQSEPLPPESQTLSDSLAHTTFHCSHAVNSIGTILRHFFNQKKKSPSCLHD